MKSQNPQLTSFGNPKNFPQVYSSFDNVGINFMDMKQPVNASIKDIIKLAHYEEKLKQNEFLKQKSSVGTLPSIKQASGAGQVAHRNDRSSESRGNAR